MQCYKSNHEAASTRVYMPGASHVFGIGRRDTPWCGDMNECAARIDFYMKQQWDYNFAHSRPGTATVTEKEADMPSNSEVQEVVYQVQRHLKSDIGQWANIGVGYSVDANGQTPEHRAHVKAERLRKDPDYDEFAFRVIKTTITVEVCEPPAAWQVGSVYRNTLHDSRFWECVHVFESGDAILVTDRQAVMPVSKSDRLSYTEANNR